MAYEPRFRPLQVRPDAPHNASQERSGRCQAAYATLLHLYPAQSATLTTRLNASLMALASTEKVESIAAGVAWGQTVADAIWTLAAHRRVRAHAAAIYRRAGCGRNTGRRRLAPHAAR